MIKCYVMIDGVWVRVVRVHGWYDLFSWVCAGVMVGTVGILLWKNLL